MVYLSYLLHVIRSKEIIKNNLDGVLFKVGSRLDLINKIELFLLNYNAKKLV